MQWLRPMQYLIQLDQELGFKSFRFDDVQFVARLQDQKT
jgi:hypothetical protein